MLYAVSSLRCVVSVCGMLCVLVGTHAVFPVRQMGRRVVSTLVPAAWCLLPAACGAVPRPDRMVHVA